jgi:hypothetical protein
MRPGTRGTLALTAAVMLATVVGSPAVPAQQPTGLVLVTGRADPSEPYHFIGGRKVAVPLTIYGPKPNGLTVWAELRQLSSRLAVPVAGAFDVPLDSSAQPGGGFVSQVELPVPLPAVSRETDFELQFQSSWPPARAVLAAGRIALRVYPDNLLAPVRLWSESHSIHLEDGHGSVTNLFREQRVTIANRSGRADLTVYAGSPSDRKQVRQPSGAGQAVIVIAERESAVPHLVVDRTGRGTTVRVETRLLDGLTTDPLAQKIFLEAFQRAVISDDGPALQGVNR